jgi:hypothetical protein
MCARDGECIESCKVTPLTDYIYTQSKELEVAETQIIELKETSAHNKLKREQAEKQLDELKKKYCRQPMCENCLSFKGRDVECEKRLLIRKDDHRICQDYTVDCSQNKLRKLEKELSSVRSAVDEEMKQIQIKHGDNPEWVFLEKIKSLIG